MKKILLLHALGRPLHDRAWLLARDPGALDKVGAKNQLPHDYVCPQAVRTRLPAELYPTSYIAERARELERGLGFLFRREGRQHERRTGVRREPDVERLHQAGRGRCVHRVPDPVLEPARERPSVNRPSVAPAALLATFGTCVSVAVAGVGAHYLLFMDWTLAMMVIRSTQGSLNASITPTA